MNIQTKFKKTCETEFGSKVENSRDNFKEESTKYFNAKLSKMLFHENLKELIFDDVLTVFDAICLYPGAMYDEKSVYPKRESEFVFKL